MWTTVCPVAVLLQVLRPRMHNSGLSLVVTSLWGAAVAGHFDEELFAGVCGGGG